MSQLDQNSLDALAEVIDRSGLIPSGSRVVALASGGPDSTALLGGLVTFLGPEHVHALHLDYRFRADSSADRAAFLEASQALGVQATVHEPEIDRESGNTQALARDARYLEAERLRAELGCPLIATGHTRTDLVETMLYRLAVSPGSRALLGLSARRENLVRPLLELSRDEIRKLVEATGLPFHDDPTNAESVYARNRIRNEIFPVLDEIGHGSVQPTIAETHRELEEQAEALELIAGEALDAGLVASYLGVAVSAETLTSLHPAVRQIALRLAAERAAGGRPVALGRERAGEIWRLAQQPEGGVVELGGGVEARLEFGQILFVAAGSDAGSLELEPTALDVPGSCRLGEWEVRAEVSGVPRAPEGPEVAICSRERLGDRALTVRTWSEGDRIAPLGIDGSKSLSDLFADRRIPRSLRHRLPVVSDSTGQVVWVAGVAVSREFAASADDPTPALITASVAPDASGAALGA